MKTVPTQEKKPRDNYKKELFFYLCILTGLFLVLQVGFVFQVSDFYLSDIKELANHIKIPLNVIPPTLAFIFIQLFLHFLFVVLIWIQARLVGAALNYSGKKIERIGLVLWGLSIFAIILANQYFYPNSKSAVISELIFSYPIARDLLVILTIFLSAAWFVALLGFFKILSAKNKIIILILCLILFAGYEFKKHGNAPVSDAATIDKPNVIIIGLDSIRPDFLGYFGNDIDTTPNLDKFFSQATVFSESLTPIARTFPSWASILTGEYPKKNGIRTNLQDVHGFEFKKSLASLLRQKGYSTVFSTDETRFSNIDQSFGFDQVITPSVGYSDFLLGTMNDFPFSNLLVNTTIGKWLFPYSYGNRPASATYDPNSFLSLLEPILQKPRKQPLFLAVHLCLAHSPYYWGHEIVPPDQAENYQLYYRNAVSRVDKQFRDLVRMLEKNNLLKHSIIIVLSDHGEAIELHGDRVTDPELFVSSRFDKSKTIPIFYPPSKRPLTMDQSAGHGTDVLGISQYHTVLAFRFFGLNTNQAATIPGWVSLLDIKPTVLNLLGLNYRNETGHSLKDFIAGKKMSAHFNEHFFTESDFSPQAIKTVHPETKDVLLEGIKFYNLNPNTLRFTVKDDMQQMIITSKQYADYYQHWVLALYPQNKKVMIPILVNLKTGAWTNDLTSSLAQQSPANIMLQEMQRFFGNDITQIQHIS